jgi:RNA polymerase sigma factor (sigma-70 family)
MSLDKPLAQENLGLVHLCANRFKNRGIEYEELFSAGCVGLLKAVRAFDADRGVLFSTYAVPVILGEIKRLFRDGGAIKVSRGTKELSLRLARLREKYMLQNGSEPTVSQLAALAPRFGTMEKPVRERGRDQIIHQLQRGASADDDLGGLHVEKLGKELSCGGDAEQIAVIADVERAVKTILAVGKHLQHIVGEIELRLAGLAARHVKLQSLCLNGLERFVHGFELCLKGGLIQLRIRDHKCLLSTSYNPIIT